MAQPISSVDPTAEFAAIAARLRTLQVGQSGIVYDEGIVPGKTVLPLDGFGKKLPYRDLEPGSVTPSANGRTVAGNEQQQPHVWAFQIHHFGATRKVSWDLSVESDRLLLGWQPSANASVISTFFFNMYDETSKNGEHLGWITTRFYECTLGVSPDFSLEIV